MTSPERSPLTRPTLQVGVAAIILVLLCVWAFRDAFVPPTDRACLALYRAARTTADTARVDATIPGAPAERSREARSCGAIRHSARWF